MAGPDSQLRQDLQTVFEHAAATLPQRVFQGAQLEWKAGRLQEIKQLFSSHKIEAESEIARLVRWRAAKPAGSARSGPTIGNHRQPRWRSARPAAKRSGILVAAHRVGQTGKLSDLLTASKRAHVRGTALDMLMEGVKSGIELATLKPSEVAPTFAARYEPDFDPGQKEAIEALAKVVAETGVLNSELAIDIAGVLPIIGAVTNLGTAVTQGIKAGMARYHANEVVEKSELITAGNPRAALFAVQRLFKRQRTEYAIKASINGISGGMQLAGTFVDFGAATGPTAGLLAAAARLTQAVFIACRYYSEFRHSNAALAQGRFTIDLIHDCPLLGCYLITEAELSTLLAFLHGSLLPANWMDEVEALRPSVEETVRLANACQRKAPFALRRFDVSQRSVYKGEHMLDFRIHKSAARIAHEAKLIAKRDPRNLRFFSEYLRRQLGL